MFRLKGIPKTFVLTLYLTLGVGIKAQQPFDVDTTFRCGFNDWYVSSIFPLADGTLLLSGKMRYPEVTTFTHRSSIKVDANGGRIDSFQWYYSAGGGKHTGWGDKIYVTNGTVHRLLGNGLKDSTFNMSGTPYFGFLQGGDYHVYPDGSILMTGAHTLNDTARGFVGIYNLIWFTNTGRLDTTKIHRRASGAVYEIAPMDNGQFLCYGTGDIYEGQPVGGIFRVNADGSLDPTLQCPLRWGEAYSILPLPDGRFYAAGKYSFSNGPQNIIRLARFLPNGALDPTFDNAIDFDLGEIPDPGTGAVAGPIQPWENGSLLVMGAYQFVNDNPRKGICVIDSMGQLLDVFDGCGVDPYVYQGFTYGGVSGYLEDDNGMAYIWGAYHGYNDGTTNDTLQRFVTRLYGPDFTTSVQEESPQDAFTLYPNPAHGTVELRIAHPPAGVARVRIYDPSGRQVLQRSVSNTATQLDVAPLANGMYLVEVEHRGQRVGTTRLAVQH